MDLTRVITGSIRTEKAERQKLSHTYTLTVHPDATKIDVLRALKKHFGVEATGVRMLHVRPKVRLLGAGRAMAKRHASKRAIVTLDSKAKSFDLSQFTA
jgi:ribosomal protein L23